jgi:class 3 adenylate cyclase
MDRQTIVVSLLTILEALYISTMKAETKQSRYDFTKFLACRLTIVLIMIALRVLASFTQWIHRNAFGGQTLLLITSIVTSGIFFASYDAMAMPSQDFNLSFMLVYFLASRQYNFLFYPSLAFVAFAVVLMLRVDIEEAMKGDGHLYYSTVGQGLFVALSFSNAVVAHDEEQSSRLRYKALKAVELTQDRIDRILRTLMPPLVVQGMRPGEPHQSHHYKLATVAQSDLCGFTKLASSKSPAEVIGFISDLFGLFDCLTDVHKVYKIETAGDAYIAGMANQPLTEHNSPFSVLLFGLDMVVKTNQWARQLGVDVTCRVGVHHGECTGGIVGNDMQRYHLFGELLTSLDILESTSVEGRVQVSLKAKEAVEAQLALTNPDFQAPTADLLRRLVIFDRRADPQLVTSKGETHEYNKVGGITFLVREQNGK